VADSGDLFSSALGCVTWWRSYVSSVECMSFPGDGGVVEKESLPSADVGWLKLCQEISSETFDFWCN
jgi:hypothetical protein